MKFFQFHLQLILFFLFIIKIHTEIIPASRIPSYNNGIEKLDCLHDSPSISLTNVTDLIDSIHTKTINKTTFSGVHLANSKESATEFGAAWFVPLSFFISGKKDVDTSNGMAAVSFSIVRQKLNNQRCILTNDAFDFFVEHLSVITNRLNSFTDIQLFNEIMNRLEKSKFFYQKQIEFYPKLTRYDHRQQDTLAILVFSTNSFSATNTILQSNIRKIFFEITFWSIYRYFPYIIIYTATDDDYRELIRMNLPFYRIFHIPVEMDSRNRTATLPREAIRHSYEWLGVKGWQSPRTVLNPISVTGSKDEIDVSQFKYIFFSEGDQILHIRHMEEYYNLMDFSNSRIGIVPHRFQSLPVSADLPDSLHSLFPLGHPMRLSTAPIITENPLEIIGSCCDSGFYRIESRGWWYTNPQYGLREMTWFKFGNTGLTLPSVTEHREKCEYSFDRRDCDPKKRCMIKTDDEGYLDPLSLCTGDNQITIIKGPEPSPEPTHMPIRQTSSVPTNKVQPIPFNDNTGMPPLRPVTERPIANSNL